MVGRLGESFLSVRCQLKHTQVMESKTEGNYSVEIFSGEKDLKKDKKTVFVRRHFKNWAATQASM